MSKYKRRNCFNCLFFPYSEGYCDSCSDTKLSNWSLGFHDYQPRFMYFTRYIPDYFESEDFNEEI